MPVDADSVQVALEAIRQRRRLNNHPLLETAAVQNYLRHAALPPTTDNLEWAAATLLAEIVQHRWTAQRTRLGLAMPDPDAAGANARITASEDFSIGDRDLEAWSCLHFRFFATGALQIQELGAIVHSDSPHGRRMISRRMNRGFHLLADALHGDEVDAAVVPRMAPHATRPNNPRRPGNLPRRATPLIERGEDLQEVARKLSISPLTTLIGPPGVGKTRVAIRAAREQLQGFGDSAWFLDLSEAQSAASPASLVMWALGLPQPQGRPPLESLALQLQSWQALLVLDDCQFDPGACAELVSTLIATCPGLRFIATGREPLHVDGERVHRLRPLSTPPEELWSEPSKIFQFGAVGLFVDRAAAARDGFHLSKANAPAVAEIVSRLDGLPLAIELVAARVSVFGVQEIRDRLTNQLDLFTHNNIVIHGRHHSLESALESSYGLLGGDERRLLDQLSVFGGGFHLSEAESVCGGASLPATRVAELLAQLVDKSLVDRDDEQGVSRYRLLMSTRAFARKRLEASGPTAALRLRHAAVFLNLVEQAGAGIQGPEPRVWLELIQRDYVNILSAIKAGLAEAPELALALTTAMIPLWGARGYFFEGNRWLERALEAAPEAASTIRLRALLAGGDLAINAGDMFAARVRSEEAIACAESLGDVRSIVEACANLGFALSFLGQFELAASTLERGIAEAASLDPPPLLAKLYFCLGHVDISTNAFESARSHATRGLAIAESAADAGAAGRAHLILSYAAHGLRQGEQAREHLKQSLRLASAAGDSVVIAASYWSLGRVAHAAGDHASVRAYCAECAALVRESGLHVGFPHMLELAAGSASAVGQYHVAAQLLGAAEALRERMSTPLPPGAMEEWQQILASVKSALNAESLAEAWDLGRRLGTVDALDLAATGDGNPGQ